MQRQQTYKKKKKKDSDGCGRTSETDIKTEKKEEGTLKGKSQAMNLKRNQDMTREEGQTKKNGHGVNKGLRKGGVQSGDVW